jgi:hypothetical protein
MRTTILFVLIILGFTSCYQGDSEAIMAQNRKIREKTNKLPEIQKDTFFDFENYKLGKLPKNWTEYFTGRGKSTEWKIVDEQGNKVLAQLSTEHPNYHFNEIVFDGFIAKDIKLSVKMKGVKGRMDQGGGFVWRFTDPGNYYVVRANPLEDNVVLYKVVNGKRTDLPVLGKGDTYGVDVPALGNDWNDLELIVKGNLFSVFLNKKLIFKVADSTFTNAGKVGLWTKADAVSYFDDFRVSR